jgi:hypothetical protein
LIGPVAADGRLGQSGLAAVRPRIARREEGLGVVEPPTDERCDRLIADERCDRLIASAVRHFEEAFFAESHAKLPDQIRVRLDALIGAEISVEAVHQVSLPGSRGDAGAVLR